MKILNRPIDITMIAALRPAIVKNTLRYLKKNLIYDAGFRLILTVAPVGEDCCSQHDIINLATKFFPNVITRISDSTSQPEAQKWVWSQVTSSVVLQFEDDWKLLEPIEIKNIVNLTKLSDTAMVYFDIKRKSAVNREKIHQHEFKKVGLNIYMRTGNQTFGGPPALVSKKFIQAVLPRINKNERFDITSNKKENQAFLQNWKFYVYASPFGNRGIVRDTGRKWAKKNNIIKNRKVKNGSWKIGTDTN